MKDKEKITYEKIEIDEKTGEPIITCVPASDIKDSFTESEKATLSDEELESVGQQLIMNKVFGIEEEKENDSVSKNQALFKKIWSTLFILFAGGVIGITAYNDFFSGNKDLPTFGELIGVLGDNIMYLGFAFIALFFCFFLKGTKLSFFCKKETGKWHFKTCFGTGIIGQYYNNVTPLAAGGQAFEIRHLAKHGVQGGVAASLPIASFFLQQFAFVLLAIISLILYEKNTLEAPQMLRVFPEGLTVLAIIGIICCFTVPFLVVLFSLFPRITQKIVSLIIWLGAKLGLVKNLKELNYKMTKYILQNAKALRKFVRNPFTLFFSLILGIGENLALCSIAYFSLRFFGYDLPLVDGFTEWMQVCVVCILLYAAISFIPTPGNSGAADLSFYLLFQSGLHSIGNVAFPALFTWRLLSFYSFIIVGFIFTRISRAKERKRLKYQS